jgi:predicted O-methyltransferase YrrM
MEYTDRGDMESYNFFLYSFVRGYKPGVILEIGVFRGISTTSFFKAIEDGKIKSIYHGVDINEKCKIVFDSYKNSRFGIRLFHNDTSDNVAKDWNLPIDLLMIDGSHEYEQVYKDFYNFGSWVKPGGFVFIKGTYKGSKYPSNLDTAYRIIEDLDNLFDEEYKHITLPYSFGLTICEKR